jgi:hypothetical protein
LTKIHIERFIIWHEYYKLENKSKVKIKENWIEGSVNTKIWHRKESELWAQLGEKICPEEGRFLQKDSAKGLAVGSWLPLGKETICADFAGLRDDVARAEETNGRISNHI